VCPTPIQPEPIQLDQVPREYDAAAVQRVLEASIRRVMERSNMEAPPAAPIMASSDPLPWVL
jgi:hypothetical protein